MKHLRFHTLFTPVVATACLLLNSSATAGSQKEGQIHLTEVQASSFQEALSVVADESHIAIVAEGVPLHPHLSPQDAVELVGPTSPQDEINKVAAAYDYSVQDGGTVFILKKRYSLPDDLPALTLAECTNALQNIQKIAAPFSPQVPEYRFESNNPSGPPRLRSPLLDPFFASLTSNQLWSMRQSKLNVAMLTSEQQKLVYQVLLHLYVQKPLEELSIETNRLDSAEAGTVFSRRDLGATKNVFGYTLPQQNGDHVPFHPLSLFNGSDGPEGLAISTSDSVIDGPDPTDPTPSSAIVTPATTLSEAALSLGFAISSVDGAVASKPITLVGCGNAPREAILKAIAEAYGLSFSGTTATTYKISLPDVQPSSHLSDLRNLILSILPDPMLRASHLDQIVAKENALTLSDIVENDIQQPIHPDVEETPDELAQAIRQRTRVLSTAPVDAVDTSISDAQIYCEHLRISGIKQLRFYTDPLLLYPSHKVAISGLPEQARQDFASVLMVDDIRSLLPFLLQPTPRLFKNFDQIMLSGGATEENGTHSFTLDFNTLTPDGKLILEAGITGPNEAD